MGTGEQTGRERDPEKGPQEDGGRAGGGGGGKGPPVPLSGLGASGRSPREPEDRSGLRAQNSAGEREGGSRGVGAGPESPGKGRGKVPALDTCPSPKEGLDRPPARPAPPRCFVGFISLRKPEMPRPVVSKALKSSVLISLRNRNSNRSYLDAENPNFVPLGRHCEASWGVFISCGMSSAPGCPRLLHFVPAPGGLCFGAAWVPEGLGPLALVRQV